MTESLSFREPAQSQIVLFYRGLATDNYGRRLDEYLTWDDEQLERIHDYIQWMFPLPERSGFNSSAPVLSPEDMRAFQSEEELVSRLEGSFRRFLRFLGFELLPDGTVAPAASWLERSSGWLTYGNHNHLRITRVLKSMSLLGGRSQAQALLRALEKTCQGSNEVSPETWHYWQTAVLSPIFF